MDILNQFGIKWELLAAQAVNFFVLLIILNTFAYKPVLKVLKDRRERIAKSLKDAEEIEKKLQKTNEDREKILAEAATEGQRLIDEATKAGQEIISEARQNATLQMEKILQQGQEMIRLEKEKMQQEIRAELADLVVVGIEKVAGKVLNQKDQKQIVERNLKELRN